MDIPLRLIFNNRDAWMTGREPEVNAKGVDCVGLLFFDLTALFLLLLPLLLLLPD